MATVTQVLTAAANQFPILPADVRQTWVDKCCQYVALYRGRGLSLFLAEEIQHYAKVEDIAAGRVPMGREKLQMQILFQGLEQAASKQTDPYLALLQEPAVTLGSSAKGERCPHCGGTDTLTVPVQNRSSDEPTNFYLS